MHDIRDADQSVLRKGSDRVAVDEDPAGEDDDDDDDDDENDADEWNRQDGNAASGTGNGTAAINLRHSNAGGNGQDETRVQIVGGLGAAALAGISDYSRSPGSGISSWRDVRHLDVFLSRIYQYYIGKGFLCIMLTSITNLALAAFVIFMSTFLLSCVNYDLIQSKKRLADIVDSNCVSSMSVGTLIALGVFCLWWILQFVRFCVDVPRVLEMQAFYANVLGIPDDKLQYTLWSDVVNRIIETRQQLVAANPSISLRQLDAHIIANRILRKDNYLIALFNKDILDLSVPFLGSRQIMTKLMEWNLSFCIFSYVFDEKGMFRKRFLKESQRTRLAEGLVKRFQIMAIVNLVFSPFMLIFLMLYSVFKYAEEYQKNPSGLGARQYSPFAWWKFREFNELPHLLQQRLYRSSDAANMYIRQFPKEYLIIIAKFVSFIAGSLGAILLGLTLFEEELQQGFEITPGRSAFFYIGLFGTILALSRSLIPPETEVFEPEHWMREVVYDTHYFPDEWRTRAHTNEARSSLTSMEPLSMHATCSCQSKIHEKMVFAPIILYYSLPPCAPAIVDFFREFSVHVDSIGYVCSFAVFDFKRHGNVKFGVQVGQAGQTPTQNMVSNEGKMEHSFINFKVC
eukprot:jgi/Hompol1/5818/HPOL_004766-RA